VRDLAVPIFRIMVTSIATSPDRRRAATSDDERRRWEHDCEPV
jgi:hypothetical protein